MKCKNFVLIYFIVATINNSCTTTKSSTFGYKKTEAKDTITSLQQNTTTKLVVFKAGNGKLYYAENVVDSATASLLPPANPANFPSGNPVDEKYRNGQSGGVREQAKTTFATASFKTIIVKNLFTSLLSTADMDQFNLGNTSIRVAPEIKNVYIKKAYLYIVKHEDDNDYHFIFGDKPNYKDATYIMNGEISGLPVNFKKDSSQLRSVRQKAVDFFTTIGQCGSSNYILSIPIEIKGSLFFDFFHRNNTAKCLLVQSKTAWEIHPVYDIKFN
ncbi:MAG: hypothetical protein ABIQ07_07525 [Ginsengibacter sp.]